jgi:hypothetical protein
MENKEDFDLKMDRILAGIQKAVRKMVEESALRDDTVVIGDQDGIMRHIPAREALKMLENADSKPV